MSFIDFIENNTVKVPWSGCSIWMGAVTHGGYAQSNVAARTEGTTIVHRALFQHLNGSIPNGMYICHSCDTPSCVNIDHLFLGTPKDNAQDRKKKRRSASKQGELNGNSKLKFGDVVQIKKLINRGDLQKDIASRFGVSVESIGLISRGLTWRCA